MNDDMPMPAGWWFLPRRTRRYLTYRREFSVLVRARRNDGWPVSSHKAGQLAAEARQTAELIMEVFG